MSKTSAPLPGFNAPSVGFEQPFEMLEACHQRVQRSLNLLRRVRQHIAQHGHDADSRSAITDVLRYFDLAGPLHHQDEELHIFPALQHHPDAAVRAAAAELQADHLRMHAQWSRLRQVLLRWQTDPAAPPPCGQDDALIDEFIDGYQRHIQQEETVAYPAARPAFDAARLRDIGGEMAHRRHQNRSP
ncbi:MAG: hemerythrin domain-containing protein [Desulfovibrionaceae bacterium]|jgi:hemerythrin-like domain-containing protein|nr:hemerythrin domain-containing protein [Desulfovibrionaceae bacterium]